MQVRDLVDQIRRVRDNKINQGLELVTGPLTAKLNNLCCMELNTLRPFFLGSLDQFLRISRVRVPVVTGHVSGYITAAAPNVGGAVGSCGHVLHALHREVSTTASQSDVVMTLPTGDNCGRQFDADDEGGPRRRG
jgi:hypothetical protein